VCISWANKGIDTYWVSVCRDIVPVRRETLEHSARAECGTFCFVLLSEQLVD